MLARVAPGQHAVTVSKQERFMMQFEKGPRLLEAQTGHVPFDHGISPNPVWDSPDLKLPLRPVSLNRLVC